jgi:hypothetical protein
VLAAPRIRAGCEAGYLRTIHGLLVIIAALPSFPLSQG